MKNNTLIFNLIPLNNINSKSTKFILYVFFGSLLIAISSKIQVPFWPVPMTMQTFVVMFISMAYGWRLAFSTLAFYLFQGALGIPVFATGSGIAYLVGPTGGYLLGMLIASAIMGYFADLGYGKNILKCLLPLSLGTIIIFTFGVGYLGTIIGFDRALQAGLLPFIPSEIFKIGLALILVPQIWKIVKS
ncbi:MAG: Biotin transporter BioY2 [Alphaproteobacteria bacterium MarineAlpha5_Bin9]|nr:MAG: Biotin transporter BioY2 [Alphaproteobacteria bacterium MarineAlpha5_Bin9]|tara:strand:- start:12756 stop:13322 length:567 start_codon:yes stop_codon:yes gene_type:complete